MNISGAGNAAILSHGLLGTLVSNSASIQNQLSTLTEQSSTGLVAQTFGGLGSGAQVALDLSPQLAQVSAYTQNIDSATTNLNLTTQVLGQLEGIASTFYSATLSLSTGTSGELSTLASQAQQALGQVQNLLNTQSGANYLLAGQDTANPPAPDTAFNAYVTSVQTAVAGLPTAGAAATEAATLAAATTGSPFSSTLGTAPQTMAVGFGVTARIGVVAGQNAYAPSSTTGSTGSYVKDLIRSLSTIAALNSAPVSASAGFTTLVADTHTDLGNAVSAINDETAGVGTALQSLTADQTNLGNTKLALTKQISNVENVDAAATATALTQAQTQLQISYKLIATMQSLSLLQYLPLA
jgi:flagellar hook-associated protein 3 FlgL